ncbi:MAG: D-3-phosphoglycerate dehydrogenase / 2-oxoglutarate reductase [Carnobacterium sp.]|uniref:3-phosphoglycerate dehydrogenase family protein n=1 Tax=Carnobacterium sp. TaxID=48221 RepID=UPI0026482EBD|nr:3-phosphoglycerate dehydrogenase family protein [Carnobacterium sp.]MDN5372389.1 D-3-phosphoglycerate dehydrogenase / 2-oxoglutarate reductase [Carnobacterium sp.]
MYTIKTYNAIAEEGLKKFNVENYQLNQTDDPDGIVLRSQNLHDMKFSSQLKAIARAGAGTNNIPIQECTEKGIVVFNTPGANANAVKELVLASLLLAVRPIIEGVEWVKTLEGPDIDKKVEAEKKRFVGSELAGKQLGVIGLGSIGAMVANDAYRLGMDVVGYDPYVSVDTAWSISSRVKRVLSIEEVLTTSDYITVHVPLLDSTRAMISAEKLALIKKEAVLLNFARGELVDLDAVISALKNGQLKSYLTDFADERLIEMDNVVVLPHLGASTEEAEINCAKMASKTLKYFLETGNIVHSVNFPTVEMVLNFPLRLAIINRNITNMVAQMSIGLAEYGVNIVNIMNKSRGDYAYTLIDIESIPEEKLMDIVNRIKSVAGILSVRVIKNESIK